jgi:hypothetical protein
VTQVTVSPCLAASPREPEFSTLAQARSEWFESAGTAQREITMHTLFDDIATVIVTAAFALASAWACVAVVASAI